MTKANGDWNVSVTGLPPGPVGLVVEQIFANLRSGRSEPRAFKIRPPTLALPNINFPTDSTADFYGDGHFDEHFATRVQLTLKEGPGTAPPHASVGTDGKWQTAPTNWPLGISTVEVIQQIADGANGWIDSLPLAFTVKRALSNVEGINFTLEYRPAFSGKGFTGATVRLVEADLVTPIAPDAPVQNGQWSSRAIDEWGPTFERKVYFRQFKDEHESPHWIEVLVNIPPLAPKVEDPVEDGLSPKFSGTCWPGARVNLVFSDDGTVHEATVTEGSWTFQRAETFAPDITHTVTVTQTAAQQTSAPASRTFTVAAPMRKPQITQPQAGSKVGRPVTVEGKDGMAGATLQLRDARFERPLGDPKVLAQDGDWSIELDNLEFVEYTVDAQQTLDGRPSERSELHIFKVVLLPPEFVQPMPGGTLPRTAKLEGRGMANGYVEVFLEGVAEPLLTNVPVGRDGRWEGEVTLPVGSKTLWARQTFTDEKGQLQASDKTESLHYDVVPAAPFVESPTEGKHIGGHGVVAGFGVPGDTVTVSLTVAARSVQASTIVQADRTWVVTQDFSSLVGGACTLEVVASLADFTSLKALRPVVLGTFLPTIDEPAAGQWVVNPVTLAGSGRTGTGDVESWWNPDLRWASALPVTGGKWRGSTQALPATGNWYRFQQTITDGADGATMSDRVTSARFEVEPAADSNAGTYDERS
ncbi:hypothetical protein [Pseudomonas sp. A34-9]|uniref:hypothetical protein n=1 Tax=Pseudomonas sp. A34-9 TaxID=3034675 RepID=UPI00240D76AE|nr:hypothetical protein [Pseudomonas sp. A34-9]